MVDTDERESAGVSEEGMSSRVSVAVFKLIMDCDAGGSIPAEQQFGPEVDVEEMVACLLESYRGNSRMTPADFRRLEQLLTDATAEELQEILADMRKL